MVTCKTLGLNNSSGVDFRTQVLKRLLFPLKKSFDRYINHICLKEKNFHFWWPGPDDVMRPLYWKNGLYQKGTKRIFDLHRLKYQNQQKNLRLAIGVNCLQWRPVYKAVINPDGHSSFYHLQYLMKLKKSSTNWIALCRLAQMAFWSLS